jgi:hypothetical protein
MLTENTWPFINSSLGKMSCEERMLETSNRPLMWTTPECVSSWESNPAHSKSLLLIIPTSAGNLVLETGIRFFTHFFKTRCTPRLYDKTTMREQAYALCVHSARRSRNPNPQAKANVQASATSTTFSSSGSSEFFFDAAETGNDPG